jgi:flagellar hook-associated protein 3 FlgL
MRIGLDSSSERFLQGLQKVEQALQRAQQEVGTGRRVQTPGDDPDSVSQILQVRAELARIEQNASDLQRVETEVDGAEGALQHAAKLLDRVRTLGAQGATDTSSAGTRAGLAGEVGAILERLVALANTEVDGRRIFSGDSDQTMAFLWDGTQSTPWGAYLGTPSTRRVPHPNGITFAVARDAGMIFANPDPSKNVLQSVKDLRDGLAADDEAAIKTAMGTLAGSLSHVNSTLTFYGNVQSQVAEAVTTAGDLKVRLNGQLSILEDADLATAIVQMQQLQFQRQAALQVRGAMPRTTLFDVLG